VSGQDYVSLLPVHGTLHGTGSVCSKTGFLFLSVVYSALLYLEHASVYVKWMHYMILSVSAFQ